MSAGLVASLAGLFFGIIGAVLLMVGVLVRDMATWAALGKDPSERSRWWKNIPLAVASCCGSRNVVKYTTPNLLGGYVLNFWGVTLLVVGFILQAVGQIVPPGVCR
jgi:hypothetical protein